MAGSRKKSAILRGSIDGAQLNLSADDAGLIASELAPTKSGTASG